jgi:hypothetical protein
VPEPQLVRICLRGVQVLGVDGVEDYRARYAT